MSDDDRPKTFSLHELAAGDGRFSCTRKQLAAWLLNAGIVTSRSGDLLTLTEHGRAMVREVGPGLRLEALHPDDDTHHERSRTASPAEHRVARATNSAHRDAQPATPMGTIGSLRPVVTTRTLSAWNWGSG